MRRTWRIAGPGICLAGIALVSFAALNATVPTKEKPSDAAWKPRPVRTVASLSMLPPEPKRDSWGGRADRQGKKIGFFHTEKIGGRWWLVDPDGGLFLHVGVNTVRPGAGKNSEAAFAAQFGTTEKWAKKTTGFLRENGFNGVGSWSDFAALRQVQKPLIYTIMGNGTDKGGFLAAFARTLRDKYRSDKGESFPDRCLPIFHPDFPAFCAEFAKPLAVRKDDPYLLGYFSDNELVQGTLETYLSGDQNDPVFGSTVREARQWLAKRRAIDEGAVTLDGITDADRDDWQTYLMTRYFAVTTAAIRKADPHHLCLGSRLFGADKRKPGLFRAAGKYLDIVAVNVYGAWDPRPPYTTRWTEWSGKPCLVSEFYAKDADNGLTNTTGAGWLVPTQRDRGLFYETFVLGLLEAKNIVGWHWFRYQDNDPEDTTADRTNGDANKGIVSVRYAPYDTLLTAQRNLNTHIYALTDTLDRAAPKK